MKLNRWLLGLGLWAAICRPGFAAVDGVRVGTGFSAPTFATAPDGDADRLFVLEKGGNIKILDLNTGVSSLFYTVTNVNTSGERGLLGMAFHPDYATNGLFYVDVVNNTTFNTEIREYSVVGNTVNFNRTILTIPQPAGRDNHKGGWIDFSPTDGYLYIATGDGGSGNDPDNFAQNKNSLLGKILRIDVNSTSGPLNYSIPSTNPFVSSGSGAPEVWAYGLRNPYRNSFDSETGDLYIADVGQGAREEINFQAANSAGGENYGWRPREGTIATPGIGEPTPVGAKDPFYDYGRAQGSTVIGGYVYHGSVVELDGLYLFADFGSNKVWSLDYDPLTNAYTGFTDWTSTLNPGVGNFGIFSSFAEGGTGELYIVSYGGDIYAIVPEPHSAALVVMSLLMLGLTARRRRSHARA